MHSNGNIGYNGQKVATYPWGNNHGSIIKISDDYYVFGHRQTNYSEYSRQGVCEKIIMDKDGFFSQAEMTSFGLSKETPKAKGIFPASIACVLTRDQVADKITKIKDKNNMPMITQINRDGIEEESQYITNISNNSMIGYRYFDFLDGKLSLIMKVKGNAQGKLTIINENNEKIGEKEINISNEGELAIDLKPHKGKHALLIMYQGSGHFDFYSFELK